MNTFGTRLKFTSFGESHGKALGCVIDGIPAGIKFDENFLQNELELRKPGKNKFLSPRKENDEVEILSGVFQGYTTGTPISVVVFNKDARSKDYEELKDVFRLSHADFTYFYKYGIHDYRGGGRSSARESINKVIAGAIAAMLLKEFDIEVFSGICSIGTKNIDFKNIDFEFCKTSEIFCLDPNYEEEFKKELLNVKKAKDSIGASVYTCVKNVPIGLGEVLYDKLDSKLAHALMGINGVKAVEIGSGVKASHMRGSSYNDILKDKKFLSNNSGGILGGISNGSLIEIKTHFKPTPSIFIPQESMDKKGNNVRYILKGRHDPCIAIRGSVVVNAMVRFILADLLLLNASSRLDYLKKIYTF